jgi:hypothetical protein
VKHHFLDGEPMKVQVDPGSNPSLKLYQISFQMLHYSFQDSLLQTLVLSVKKNNNIIKLDNQ